MGKPDLPEGPRPFIDRDAIRDLRASARPGEIDDVVKAFGLAGEALDEGDAATAVRLLEWVKSVAARSAVTREALGVAHYAAGDFAAAHTELLAYRRLSGRHDQNHLLADCARALGRIEKMQEYVAEMRRPDVPPDRVIEGLIVLAGERADRGDLRGALATLERVNLAPAQVEPYHLRLWYAVADLSERVGDLERAREFFEAIEALDDEYFDVGERLSALDET